MRTRLVLLLPALVWGVLIAAPAAEQEAGPRTSGPLSSSWRQIRMPGFTVVGNATSSDLVRHARELAAFRVAVTRLIPKAQQTSPQPTQVVILRDFDAFTRFQP